MRDTIAQNRFENVSKTSNDSLLAGVNTPRSDEDRLQLKELMEIYTNLQQRVLDLENTKTAQAQEITLKLRVKRLEKRGGSRTHKLKRLWKVGSARMIVSSEDEASLGDQEDASKQGRKIGDIDADEGITLVGETQGRYDEIMFDVSDHAGEEVFVAKKGVPVSKIDDVVSTAGDVARVNTATTIHVSIASVEVPVSATTTTITDGTTVTTLPTITTTAATTIKAPSTRPKAKRIMIQEQVQAPTPTVSSQQPSQVKDKGKAKMIEPEKPLKKKDQIMFDEKVALKLQAQLQAELEEEDRLARQKEEEANVALIEEWHNVQAMMDADYQMAQQLQAEEPEELSIEDKSKLFVQLLEERKKHFAALRAQEQRNKPPTKA
ncbi:hypothetical protein Tco_0644303 [Tanacetum coccineum]